VSGAAPGLPTLRLVAFAAAVALATTRIGLVVHELIGHGGVANAVGAGVDEIKLFWFAGGWIHYSRDVEWTLRDGLIVQLGGIAIELVVGALAVLWGRRRRGWLGIAVTGAGAGWMIHAGAYLAIGTWHGFGDGVLLHRALGGAKAAVAIPAGVLCVVAAYLATRALTAPFESAVPVASRAGRLALVAAAIALAGGIHAGLARAELAVRADETYGSIMRHERERAIDRELAAWLAEQRARGAGTDRAAIDARRRALDAAHRTFPFGVVLVIAIISAGVAGAARSRVRAEGPPPPLDRRTLLAAAAAAAIALALVMGAGAIFPL
jgi:hypothetical protein